MEGEMSLTSAYSTSSWSWTTCPCICLLSSVTGSSFYSNLDSSGKFPEIIRRLRELLAQLLKGLKDQGWFAFGHQQRHCSTIKEGNEGACKEGAINLPVSCHWVTEALDAAKSIIINTSKCMNSAFSSFFQLRSRYSSRTTPLPASGALSSSRVGTSHL